jgi:hypothetical protein
VEATETDETIRGREYFVVRGFAVRALREVQDKTSGACNTSGRGEKSSYSFLLLLLILLPWIRLSLFLFHISFPLFLGRPMNVFSLGRYFVICFGVLSCGILSMCNFDFSL